MRSVYTKIIGWCFGTLLLSLAGFVGVSWFVASRHGGGPFRQMDALHLEEAVEAYQAGGEPRLRAYLDRLRRYMKTEAHVTNAQGRDLLDHSDRSAMLAKSAEKQNFPIRFEGRMLIVSTSPSGYRLLVLVPPPLSLWNLAPYYVLVAAAVASLSWLLAVNIASPMRRVAQVVDRFGRGDLTARVRSKRRDEIGELARAFDQMADRIETLRTSERRLLQDISHELRSPLARLSFAAELTKTADDRVAAAARLNKEVVRLTELVGGLLQVTRLEGDVTSRNMQPIALEALLEAVVSDCEMEATARDCQLQLTLQKPVTLLADHELLRRAVENILRNAIAYAPRASSIEVALRVDASAASISVRDYGPGVPEELLPKIFKPFFRVDPSRTGATGGIGLGLAIASRAVTLHHGDLQATNAQPGLRVTLALPLPA